MVLDSSALVAILRGEDDASSLTALLATADTLKVAVPTLLETSMVLEGSSLSREAGQKLDQLIQQLSLEVVPFDETALRFAREAFRKYGKGRHPASLNFGDCISYATAKSLNDSLLYKGADFDLTDVRPAAPRFR